MKHLSDRERELVSIGAAIGSNCIPCVVFHIQEGRSKGLTDGQIREAIAVSEGVKRMPAQLVKNTALAQLEETARLDGGPCGCGDAAGPDPSSCCE